MRTIKRVTDPGQTDGAVERPRRRVAHEALDRSSAQQHLIGGGQITRGPRERTVARFSVSGVAGTAWRPRAQ